MRTAELVGREAHAEFEQSPASPQLDPETYSRNQSALRAFQPDVAAIIDATLVPDMVRHARGRDGATTFQLQDAAGRITWLGQSSMPTISAEELFSTVSDVGGNVTLPGIFTGLEPLVFARRLPECRAIFVVEANPLCLKLAMQLHDYAGLFSHGRLVFLLNDNLHGRVAEFFRAYPGYLLPTQIFRVPQRSAAEIYELQRRLESAGEVVQRIQAEALNSAVVEITRRPNDPFSEPPHVAILGSDASSLSFPHADRVARGLAKLGWTCSVCLPDSPGKCHIVARMNAAAKLDADLALWINSRAGAARTLLSNVSMVTWFSPGAVPTIGNDQSADEFFAMTDSQARSICSIESDDRMVIVEPAADDTIFKPMVASGEDSESPSDVAIVFNLPLDNAACCGVNLPSMVSVWNILRRMLQRVPEAFDAAAPESLIEEAERGCGISLQEPKIREQYAVHLRERIAPAALARADAEALAQAGFRVSIWGENWALDAASSVRIFGAIPQSTALNRIFNRAGIVVFPRGGDPEMQSALDALCAGACVVMRGGPRKGDSSGVADGAIEPFLHGYESPDELVRIVRALLSDAARRAAESQQARELVLASHTVSHRIEQIVNRLRTRQNPRLE